MRVRRLLIALMSAVSLVACAVALAGCAAQGTQGGSNAPTGESSDGAQAFEGLWELVQTTSDGTVVTQEGIERLKAFGLDVHLELASDGSAILNLFDSAEEGTWSASSSTEATIEFPGDETIDIHISEGILYMPQGTDQLEFEKSADGSSSPASQAQVRNIEPITLVDDANVLIQINQLRSDQVGDVGYVMRVDNKTNQVIRISAVEDTFSIDGQMVNLLGGQALQPGKYANVFFWFDNAVSGPQSIDELGQVEGTLQVTNADGSQVLVEYQVQF